MNPQQPNNPEMNAITILEQGVAQVGEQNLVMACSFSVEDLVVIDLLQRHAPQVEIFAIDTGRLHEETYEVAEALFQRYQLVTKWYFPKTQAVENLERAKGVFSFRESLANRHECCQIRKVEPLSRALKGRAGWITGQRRAQGTTRSELAALEIDPSQGGILKINPLFDWCDEQVWDYAKEHRLPVNRLHAQGYPSIGCAPCTRAIKPGEDSRAGRWWWEAPEHKECGMHRRDTSSEDRNS